MRAEKTSLLEEVRAKINGFPYFIVTDYTGMNVPQFGELRKRLQAVGARYTVVKNTALRIAAKDLGYPEMNGMLEGQTAIISGSQDVCSAAKIVKNFTAEFTKPKLKGGILDGALLDGGQVVALADLPSREALLAQILGLLSTPASRLARLLNTPGAQLAQVIKAHSEKGA